MSQYAVTNMDVKRKQSNIFFLNIKAWTAKWSVLDKAESIMCIYLFIYLTKILTSNTNN